MPLFHRDYKLPSNGRHKVHTSFPGWLQSFLWRVRLRQALKISEMSRQPDVIIALHKALREREPEYLRDWRRTMREVGDTVDDMVDVMNWLREDQLYPQADRIRVIAARLANSIPEHQIEYDDGRIYRIRDIARSFR